MTTADVTPSCCQNPGKFDITRLKVKMADGSVKEYVYQRKVCNKCNYRKKKFKTFKKP
jgi:hypothetical protein